MKVVPINRDDANAYVFEHHRHSMPTQGYKFALAAAHDGAIVGVAIVGRPIARYLDDSWTLEVLRVCVALIDGTRGYRNACSFLYGACWRAARALGYLRLITYTLRSESGASLKASGYRVVAEVAPRSWDTPTRPRVDKHELQGRLRWEVGA